MDAFISIIVIIIVVYSLISKSKKKQQEFTGNLPRKVSNRTTYAPKTPAGPNPLPVKVSATKGGATYYSPAKVRKDGSGHIHKFDKTSSVSELMDDRENDWLANQLREEHHAFRRISAMFELKSEHAAHCDAKMLKNYNMTTSRRY